MGPSNPRVSSGTQRVPHYRDDSSSSSSSSSSVNHELGQVRSGALEYASASSMDETPPSPPKWLAGAQRRLPQPVQKGSIWLWNWIKGPDPPRIWRIAPFLPTIQTAPLDLLERFAPKRKQKFWLLLTLYFCFLLVFITVLHESAFTEKVQDYGAPTNLGCTDTFWAKDNQCGLNGDECRPFENSTQAFRCPANCLGTQVLNPYAVGDQIINYQEIVIGGPNDTSKSVDSAVYRGDSFICSAAIHAGFLTNQEGGCGAYTLVGSQANFPSIRQHGITSTSFDSDFPLAFQFLPGTLTACKDLRWPLLAVTIVFTTLLSIFTTSPLVFFFSEFAILFFHVGLVSDPPTESSYYGLVSDAFGRFLPAAFCAFAIYKFCIRRTLDGLRVQIEKTVLWLGGCYVGCLNNYTFDKIPIQRLTPHDLRQQPGAITALVIIILVLIVVAVGQAWAFRVEGLLPRYLALYVFMGVCLGLFVAIPDMNLRIHHYILALLLLPGTAMQTRPSLLYQGLLVGLFINGIARWGFDSILQTAAELQGDALVGSALPNITQSSMDVRSSITFTWAPIPGDYDGISILVNDVERFRSYVYDGPHNFTWERQASGTDPEYFRFGYMSGSESGDFTAAGIWKADGDWIHYPEGAT